MIGGCFSLQTPCNGARRTKGPRTMIVKPISGAALAAAALTLAVAGAATVTPASAAGKVMCYGVNACKGQGACKSANNACKGQAACKGRRSSLTTSTPRIGPDSTRVDRKKPGTPVVTPMA